MSQTRRLATVLAVDVCALPAAAEKAFRARAVPRRLFRDGRYSSLARLRAAGYWGVPKTRAFYGATYFAGLRKAGMPEE